MWLKEFKNNKGIICYSDIGELAERYPTEYDLLKKWNIESTLLVPLVIDEKVVGYLGVDNYTKNESNKGLLNSIEHFISSELTRKRVLEKQQYLSEHDILTGLYNRNMYDSYCLELKTDSLLSLGIVYTSVNGLKVINERFGLVYGNSILVFLGSTLQEFFPGGSSFRYDGDEFITFVENCTQDSLIESVENFRKKCNETFENSISAGYSWMETDISVDSLFKHAEKMLQHYKTEMKVLKKNSNDSINKIYKDLRDAIDRGVFTVYLQPKESTERKKVMGAEALVRMVHPKYGIIPPEKFVPLLESENLIQYIDLFVFEQVCKMLQKWSLEGKEMMVISVNFSRGTLLETNLIKTINAIQTKYGIPRHYIEIEITESLGDVDRDLMIRMGRTISKEGYILSLDDFGAKYSNISILSAVNFNVLKMDKTLINDVFSNARSKVIIQNFLTSCKKLGIKTVAEGVETAEQYAVLKEMGFESIQGYYINKPMSEKDFEKKYL
jgi:diguanylate cyclase (GGDEF)-like protein